MTQAHATASAAAETLRSRGFRFQYVTRTDELPPFASMEALAAFLHHDMRPYHDSLPDVVRGLRHALDPDRSGFVVLAEHGNRLAGAVVILDTGMKGYVPEQLLLFACVRPDLRGQGLGRAIIEEALGYATGDVKLHVEPGNPARRLYRRVGFAEPYVEMRWRRK